MAYKAMVSFQVRNSEENFKKTKGPSMFTLYIEAISVANNENADSQSGESRVAIQFTQRDYDAIQVRHWTRFMVFLWEPYILGISFNRKYIRKKIFSNFWSIRCVRLFTVMRW